MMSLAGKISTFKEPLVPPSASESTTLKLSGTNTMPNLSAPGSVIPMRKTTSFAVPFKTLCTKVGTRLLVLTRTTKQTVFGGTLDENKATPRNELVVRIHLGNSLDTRRDAHGERTLLHAHSACEKNTTLQLQKELMVLFRAAIHSGYVVEVGLDPACTLQKPDSNQQQKCFEKESAQDDFNAAMGDAALRCI